MKLATLKESGRDGALVVVGRKLSLATRVADIAPTLQHAIDNWEKVEPRLRQAYNELNEGKRTDAFMFNAAEVHSPLPRAYQWADGSAYVNHVELVRKSRG